MSGVNVIVGDDGSNTLNGSAGKDLIYGFDPNGPQSQVTSIAATRVATGLDEPLFAGAPPDDTNRLFIVEKTGLIKILDLHTGQVLATPFLDVVSQISAAGEGGLLGLAFDPDFAHNGLFYVDLINTSGNTEVRRYHVSADPNQADSASATPIITIDQPGFSNHKAGWLGFGPDGDLYVATGDGGSGGDPFGNGQNIDSLLAKMLRLDVHGDAFPDDPSRNYAIPADNMFVGTAGADEIFALGLRNPFRDSFDRGTGTFFIADVGQDRYEEVDIGQGGANYGWNVFEGPATYAGGSISAGTLTAPIYFYDHTFGHAIIGGYVYRGESEGLQGQYFVADEVDDKLFTLSFNGTSWVATDRVSQITTDAGAINNPSSFAEDGRGNLYVIDLDGDVFRLTPLVASADQGDSLNGFGGDDMMFGGSGNDRLNGGAGTDTLIGGPGADVFVLDAAALADAKAPTPIFDRVLDYDQGNSTGVSYSAAEGDQIDLSAVYVHDGAQAISSLVRALEDGSGSFANLQVDPDGAANGANWLTIARLDGVHVGDTVNVILNSAAPAGSVIAVQATATTPEAFWHVVGAGDVSGDGRGDIFWQNDNGEAGIWLLNGASVLGMTSPNDFTNPGPAWHIRGAGDFDGDHKSDILWQNDNGQAGVWLMNGTTPIVQTEVGANFGPAWHLIGAGDFNGDGKSDFLWRNDNGQAGVWLMNGTSPIVQTEVGANFGPSWHVIGSGDFNGDGKSDFLWQNDNGQAGVWLMNGASPIAQTEVGDNFGPAWRVIGAGDFNGDGHADILWQNDNGQAGIWLMNGATPIAQSNVGANPGSAWHVIAAADFNGDGKADILWQNDNGQAGVWLMNGTTPILQTDVGFNPDALLH